MNWMKPVKLKLVRSVSTRTAPYPCQLFVTSPLSFLFILRVSDKKGTLPDIMVGIYTRRTKVHGYWW